MDLRSPIAALSPRDRRVAATLKSLGLETVRDLLSYYPFRYEDFTKNVRLAELQPGDQVTVTATIEKVRSRRAFRRHMTVTEAVLTDGDGRITALWFNQPYLQKSLVPGASYRFAGKLSASKFGTRLMSPLHEPAGGTGSAFVSPLMPVYSVPQGVSQHAIRKLVRLAEPLVAGIEDPLPEDLRRKYRLLGLRAAIRGAHFPDTIEERDAARHRLGFDELFKLELSMAGLRRLRRAKKAPAVPFDEEATKALVATLPFRLTDDQRRAAWEVLLDMGQGTPMHRLLDGDVGSGKTLVAAIAMLNSARAGFQSALMAPTEILARQHYESLRALFVGQPFSVALWTNSYRRCATDGKEIVCASKSENAGLAGDIADGRVSMIIGTHALIEDSVNFSSLALAVIDEQHRFGVRARQLLVKKVGMDGREPHLLSMTATPIPRSLALTVFGDLDLSLLRQKPKSRLPITTRLVAPAKRGEAFAFVRQQVAAGRQAFVICPLIEESETLDVVSAEEEFARLGAEDLSGIRLGLLHGRLTAAEKEDVMRDFVDRKVMVLVATSVVEVGIDVPNATVMCVTGAERFGLAQLHQFRGRVGRGEHRSYCLLMPTKEEALEKQRLQVMVETDDGFVLAERDLQMRGPGEILGQAQSGFPGFRIASLGDARLIQDAKLAAAEVSGTGSSADIMLNEKSLEKVHLE